MAENVLPRFVREAARQEGICPGPDAGWDLFMGMKREFAVRDPGGLADDEKRLQVRRLESGLRETFRELKEISLMRK